MELILASKSPRRQEILNMAGLNFKVDSRNIDETAYSWEKPSVMVTRLAFQKAYEVAKYHEEAYCIGSDTIVTLDGRKLGKPSNREEAYRMLKSLSGRTHEVITGVSIVNISKCIKVTDNLISKVKFRDLTEAQINAYLDTDEPYDKAGAYGIQGLGSILIESIEGDYQNIVGLSLSFLDRLLTEAVGMGIFEIR